MTPMNRSKFLFYSTALVFATLLTFASAPRAFAQERSLLGGLQLSAALDLFAPFPIQNGSPDSDRFRVRTGEFSFFGAVDQVFDAQLTVSGHDEVGEFEFALHEGFVASSKLIPYSRFKVGKFFLGVGRLNQFHQHDWPFISTPIVQQRFFAGSTELFQGEAAIDTGIEYSILLPIPFYLDVTLGVTNGYCYGHCHANSAEKPLAPVHYAHPVFFSSFEDGGGILFGLTYLARTDAEGDQMRIVGGDVTYKKREGKVLDWLVQSEVYHRYQKPVDLAVQEEIGGYLYAQKGLNELWALGLRLEGYSEPSLTFQNGDRRKNLTYGAVPLVSYKASEYSTVRAEYAYFNETREGDSNRPIQSVMLQLISILGSHPAHDF